MNPGTLDRKIQIQRQGGGLFMVTATGDYVLDAQGNRMVTAGSGSQRDAFGQEVAVWGYYKFAWARIVIDRGNEALNNSKEIGKRNVTFRVRFRNDLRTDDRIIYRSQAYDIVGFDPDVLGRRRALDIFTTQHTDTVA